MPYFASSRGLVTINDSLHLDNDVAIGVARSLATPKDVLVLGRSDDNQVVSDAMILSVQSVASVASVGHHLIVKSHESIIRRLKRDRAKTLEETRHQLEILQEDNQKLSKIIYFYSKNMQELLEALDRPSKRARGDSSFAKPKKVIFGSSSDKPQEAMRENPRERSRGPN
ncbi:unnamed protein product [Prunus armeniaca]